jgi:hypothetical protein
LASRNRTAMSSAATIPRLYRGPPSRAVARSHERDSLSRCRSHTHSLTHTAGDDRVDRGHQASQHAL